MRDDRFHGIDLGRVSGLVDELARWAPQVSEIQGDVLLAESLSGLYSDVGPQLEELGEGGNMLVRSINNAVTELLAHRLSVQQLFLDLPGNGHAPSSYRDWGAHVKPAQIDHGATNDPVTVDLQRAENEAQTLLDDIRIRASTGEPLRPSNHQRLEQIFRQTIVNGDTASMAYLLALNHGLSAGHALSYTSVAEIEADLDRVLADMTAGADPAGSSVPGALFPAAYRTWSMSELPRRPGPRDPYRERPPAVLVEGPGDAQYPLPIWQSVLARALPEWRAALAIGAHLGPIADGWVGRVLAPGAAGVWGDEATTAIGEIAAANQATALALFNALGAAGTADLTFALGRNPQLAMRLLPDFAAGLALASHNPGLTFTGADLINADDRSHTMGGDLRDWSGEFAETLLLAENYHPDFLLAAVLTSLASRPSAAPLWRSSLTLDDEPNLTSRHYLDPQALALAATALNGLGAELVITLGSDQIDLLLVDRSTAPGWSMVDLSTTPGELSPIELVLTQAGLDPAAARVITNAIGADPSAWQFMQHDGQITNGLSILLAMASPTFVNAPLSEQQSFIETYDLVLRGGSGTHLELLHQDLLRHDVRTQVMAAVESGAVPDLNLTNVAEFLGKIAGTRSAVYDELAHLADRSAAQFATTLDGLSIALGGVALTPGPHSIPLGLLAIATTLAPTSDPTALAEHLKQERQRLLDRSGDMQFDVIDEVLDLSNPVYNSSPTHPSHPLFADPAIPSALFDHSYDHPADLGDRTVTIDGVDIPLSMLLTAVQFGDSAFDREHAKVHQDRTNHEHSHPG